jgi:tryptophan 2,3-dioxygenase
VLAWTGASLALKECHPAVDAGRERLSELVSRAPVPDGETLAALDADAARRLALDVLMVGAFCRCRALTLTDHARLEQATLTVAERLDIPPIVSYPLYIRANEISWDRMRRFTPTRDEFRFVAMHRVIEDQFDRLIAQLRAALARDPAALAGALGEMLACMRTVNRTVAAFRSPERLDKLVFNQGFRPYFGSAELNGQTLAGPSGLQSPTFRAIAMLVGYRDPTLDSFTDQIMVYHEPDTRRWLTEIRRERDDGGALAALDRAALGGDAAHLHQAYGTHARDLLAVALADGTVSHDIERALANHGVEIGEWPRGAAVSGGEPARAEPRALLDPSGALGAAVRIDAALFGFHLEHVATTAHQIGFERGTGGTAGVEFLLLATFRRGMPRLWASGLGRLFGLQSIARG